MFDLFKGDDIISGKIIFATINIKNSSYAMIMLIVRRSNQLATNFTHTINMGSLQVLNHTKLNVLDCAK